MTSPSTNTLATAARAFMLAAALGALALTGCQKGDGGAAAGANRPKESPYATIANGKVDVEGGVVAVAARRAGIVREVYVQEGAAVKKGQMLARLEDEDSRLAVKSAEAAVAQAESLLALNEVSIRTAGREHQRLQQLVEKKMVPQQQLDQARDALDTANAQLATQQAAVQTARAQLAQAAYNQDLTIIRAPLDGKIIRRYANPGAGASTLNVSNMFDLEPAIPHIVRAEIVESAIPDVHVDQEVEVASEQEPDKLVVGKVLRIAATFGARKLQSDAATEAADERVVEVVVTTNDMKFLIGQRVLVKFMKPGEKAGVKRDNDPAAAGKAPAK